MALNIIDVLATEVVATDFLCVISLFLLHQLSFALEESFTNEQESPPILARFARILASPLLSYFLIVVACPCLQGGL